MHLGRDPEVQPAVRHRHGDAAAVEAKVLHEGRVTRSRARNDLGGNFVVQS